MYKKLTLFICLVLYSFSFNAIAQGPLAGTISGKVMEGSTSVALELAVIKLVQKKDSVIVATTVANKYGNFKITGLKWGEYELRASFIGYETAIRTIILTVDKPSVELGRIALKDGIDLDVVTLTNMVSPLKIKKDTLEFDTKNIKTAPNATTETLMKNIPGIDVDPYGNIKVHGIDASRVTVGGKKFFGDNYKIATQNLPADAIAKIQIIESKTLQATISGIDDGKREKVINLILKEDRKGGYFGSVSIAGGTVERYLASGSINHFKENLQLNLLLMSNNNNQAYSVGEASSFSGNNFGSGAVSGEVNGIAFGRISQGLTKTNSSALNFSKEWGPKGKNSLRSFYVGSLIDSKTDVQTAIQNIQVNNTFFNTINNVKQNDNQSHSLSLDYSSKVDSLTSFFISPTIGLDKLSSNSNSLTKTANASSQLINNTIQEINNDTYRPMLQGSISLRHILKQGKGSYNFSLSQDYSKSSADNYNINQTSFYTNGVINSTVFINQLQDNNNLNNTLSFRGQLSLVISKDKKTSLLTNAGLTNSTRNADQYTFEYNPVNDLYEIVVPELSNVYQNRLTQKDLLLGFNRSNSKTTLIASANLQAVTLHGNVVGHMQDNEIHRNYLAVLPRLTFSYRSDSRKSVSFNISSSLTTPTVSDLQPVLNTLNRLYIREGNPLLKPAKTYNAQLGYNVVNAKTGRYANYIVAFGLFRDNFSTSNIFDEETAISYVKPINVNGNYSLSLSASYGQPIKQFKGLNVNYGLTGSKQKSINYLNNLENNTESISLGANAGFSYSYKESLVLGFSNRSNYIDTRNSIREAADNSYFRIANTGSLSYEFIKKWRLATDLNHQVNVGRTDNFNQSVVLVNAGIQRFLMPKDQFIIELKGYDLFNQNSNITRNFSANRIEDTMSVNLRRYFLLRLTYRVNKIQSKG